MYLFMCLHVRLCVYVCVHVCECVCVSVTQLISFVLFYAGSGVDTFEVSWEHNECECVSTKSTPHALHHACVRYCSHVPAPKHD